MKDIMKMSKYLEKYGLLTIVNEVKEQKVEFHSMSLDKLHTSSFRGLSAIWSGEGTTDLMPTHSLTNFEIEKYYQK